MDVDGGLTFLFFLDAQGKELIGPIAEMLSSDRAVFFSLHCEGSPSIVLSLEECKALAKALGIMDPLGGGSYPLNYMIIVDSTSLIRCKVSLRFGYCYGGYQKFGVDFAQLRMLIEEFCG